MPAVLAIAVLSLFSQPVTGDLTRLGGYLESDFGWNEPQYGFKQPGFKNALNLDEYDKYYDIVVMGDSFSLNETNGWQNILHAITGQSIITFAQSDGFGISGFGVEAIINSRQFREHPPRYLILEFVERKAVVNLSRYAHNTIELTSITHHQPVANRSINFAPASATRQLNRMPQIGLEQRMQQAGNYLIKLLYRQLGDVGRARVYKLSRNDLFSNEDSDLLLVVDEDIYKPTISEIDAQQLAKALQYIEKIVCANGRTQFIPLIMPDKLTTYMPYIDKSDISTQSYLPLLAQYYDLPRIDIAFQRALTNGVKDLYLPNDTHTGFMGYQLAAEELVLSYFVPVGDVAP